MPDDDASDDLSARPKMRLVPRPAPAEEFGKEEGVAKAVKEPEQRQAPRLRSNTVFTPRVDEPLESLGSILHDASKGDRARERRERWMRRVRVAATFSVTFAVLLGAFYGGIRWGAGWGILPAGLWTSIVVMLALAAYLFLRGERLIRVDRQGWMGLFGWSVAAVLIAWSVMAYEAMAQHHERRPNSALWVPAHWLQAGLAVEIQVAATGSAHAYRNLSNRDVVVALRRLERSEWRGYYARFLDKSEMARVNYVNVDTWLPIVAGRMIEARAEALAPFLEAPGGDAGEGKRLRERALTWAFWPFAENIRYVGLR